MKTAKYSAFILTVTVVFVGALDLSMAQVDPTSSILLRRTTPTTTDDTFDTSRYEIAEPPAERVRQEPVRPAVRKPQAPKVEVVPQPITKTPSQVEGASAKQNAAGPELAEDSPAAESLLNVLELQVAPTYIYNHAQSDYWYREHLSSGSGLYFDLAIWVMPDLAINSSMLTSLGHSILGDPSSSRNVAITHQWFTGGIKLRNTYGPESRPRILVYGLDYVEEQSVVDKTEAQRIRHKTAGPRLYLELQLPKTENIYSFFGVEILPQLDHSEEPTTLDLKSGTSVTGDGVGIWFGRRYFLDEKHQIYWRASHRVENILFSGTSNTNDPVTTTAPENVSITNGFSMFQLGLTWGD